MIIRPVAVQDRAAWGDLYQGYAAFYEVPQTEEMRVRVWSWLMDPDHEVDGLVAEQDGRLIGLAHCRPFARPLAAATGYFLDDLFVSPAARGSGAGAALIGAAQDQARANGANVLRWITAQDNDRARILYDKVAVAGGWVTYDIAL